MKHGHAIEVQRPASKAHRTRKRVRLRCDAVSVASAVIGHGWIPHKSGPSWTNSHLAQPVAGQPTWAGLARFDKVDSILEAELAKEKMHGRLACGRPLVVRLAGDKCMLETTDRSTKAAGEGHKMHLTGWWCHGTNKSQCKNCRYKKQIEILRGGEF
ncbi:hypothetical protein JHK82_019568 [Glycine max]|nr:hypothetical protein JHK82_019568 [Glycine max]